MELIYLNHIFISYIFADGTLPLEVDLGNEDPDESLSDTFRECKRNFQGQVVLSKDGECIVNNATSLEVIGEDGKITKRIRISSIIFDISCPTLVSLTNFWDKYQSGELHSQLYSDLNVEDFKKKFNLPKLKLTVKIPEESFQICKAKLEDAIGKWI